MILLKKIVLLKIIIERRIFMRRRIITWMLCISVIFSSVRSNNSIVTAAAISMPAGIVLTGQNSYKLAGGVSQINLVTNNQAGNTQVRSFVATIDLSKDVKILANYGTYYKEKDPSKWDISGWKVSKTTSQASRYT